MPLKPEEIVFHLSSPDQRAGFSKAAKPSEALGGFVAQTMLDDSNQRNNLFGDVSGDDNAAKTVDYRCLFIRNSNHRLSLLNARVWILSKKPGGTAIEIGLDPTSPTAQDSDEPQAVSSDGRSVPPGVAFETADSEETAVYVGTIPARSVRAIWVKRTAQDTPPLDVDGMVLRVKGDTSA